MFRQHAAPLFLTASLVAGLLASADRAEATLGLLCDYNFDGACNAPDYTVWRDTNGSTTDLRADGNFDFEVNAPDYTFWAENYGAAIVATATPEPGSAAILMGAAALLARRRGSAG